MASHFLRKSMRKRMEMEKNKDEERRWGWRRMRKRMKMTNVLIISRKTVTPTPGPRKQERTSKPKNPIQTWQLYIFCPIFPTKNHKPYAAAVIHHSWFADTNQAIRDELIVWHFQIQRGRPLPNASRSIVVRAMAWAKIAIVVAAAGWKL
jgi:hypothetical protein